MYHGETGKAPDMLGRHGSVYAASSRRSGAAEGGYDLLFHWMIDVKY